MDKEKDNVSENINAGGESSEPSYDDMMYYKRRYKDMNEEVPRDVVDMLVKTHPLVGGDVDPQLTQYRTKKTGNEELDTIKEARRMRVRQEIEPLGAAKSEAPGRSNAGFETLTSEPTAVSRIQPEKHERPVHQEQARPVHQEQARPVRPAVRRPEEARDENRMAAGRDNPVEPRPVRTYQGDRRPVRMQQAGGAAQQGRHNENEEDLIQMVRIKNEPPRKKGIRPQAPQSVERQMAERHMDERESVDDEIEMLERPQRKRKRPEPEPERAPEPRRQKRRIPVDMDIDSINKAADLNNLYDGGAYDKEEKEGFFEGGAPFKISIGVIIVLILAFIFTAASLSGKLKSANDRIAELADMQVQNEQYKMQMLTLQDEIDSLRNQLGGGAEPEGGGSENPDEGGEGLTPDEGTSAPADGNSTASTGGDGEYEMYTVVSGDTPGSISRQFYGDFNSYQRILDANGITDAGSLRVGQEIRIPK